MIQEEPKKITKEELYDLKKLIEAIDPNNELFSIAKEIIKQKTKQNNSTNSNEIVKSKTIGKE